MNEQALTLAGAAKADITLLAGTPMGGFANRLSACQGVLDALYARALLLRSDGVDCLFITLDALAISAERAAHLRAVAAHGCGDVAPVDVRVVCSHTHSAADLSSMFGAAPQVEVYFERVEQVVEVACRQARAQLTPCVLSAGSTAFPIGRNRRMRPGHAQVTELERAQGAEIDHTLTALRFVNQATGALAATVFHTACHPVCLGPENLLASGDFAGIAAHTIEQRTGALALFFNGAAGNVTPIIGRGSSYSATCALGESVAERVLALRYRAQPALLRTTSRRDVTLPLDCHVRHRADIAQMAAQLLDVQTEFVGWHNVIERWSARMLEKLEQGTLPDKVTIPLSEVCIGDIRFVFVGAEVFNEYQQWAPPSTRVVSYADGEGCYVPTAAALGGGGYEVVSAPVFYGLPCAPSADAERILRNAISTDVSVNLH